MIIRKRNGSEAEFKKSNIINAISKANEKVRMDDRLTTAEIKEIAKNIEDKCKQATVTITHLDVQGMVERAIMAAGKYDVATEYITYRWMKALENRTNTTDDRILALLSGNNEEIKQENANKNPTIVSTMRDYMAGEVSKDISQRYLVPADIWKAHKDGIIHFHDMDYFAMPIHNCCLINLDDMLQNGTIISGTTIDKPHTFQTACNIASQIVAQVASSQYGGQTISATHIAKFVKESRAYFRKKFKDELPDLTDDQLDRLVEAETLRDIKNGVQTLQYQILTLQTTNGQTPFVSVCLYLNEAENEEDKEDLALVIEEILKQRMQGVKNEVGTYYANPFPKLLYVLEEDNIHEGDKYYYLTKLAAECTTKRMVPDYISEKIMKQQKISKKGEEGDCYPCMGCRSFLTPYRDPATKKPKYYGRFNQGVVSLNLPDVALSSKGDMEKFWYILEERLELCHRALRLRHEHLRGVKSDVAPILWQNGAFARLKKGETIDKLLYNGYSTISLGYAGLYECVKYMTGRSHTDPEAKPFALQVMQHMNDACKGWKEKHNIDFSLYGTPLESTTYKFSKCLQKRFGMIPGITDKSYITNSYHVHVTEEIDAFTKLRFESEFQQLSPGGAISYVEVPNMQQNIDAVLQVMQFIYDNIMYAELNTKSDYCQECGFDGEIEVREDDGKLVWVCPQCGNTDQSKMNVARRTCGYIGTQYWNQGRTQENKDRDLHL